MEVQNKQTIIIDLRRGSTVPLPHFTQYDTNILEFVVKDKGVDADLSAVTNIVVNYKPRNKEAITRTLEANGNVVTYTIGEEEMRTTGIADVSLSFFEGEKRLSTAKLKLYMNDSLGPYFEGGEGMPLLQELFVEVAASSQQTTEAANYAMEKGAEAEQAASTALEAAVSARSNPLAPVADFAAIATTYPNPQPGDETQTLDDGKVYRYLNGEWQYIRELTPGPVAALSEQLAHTLKKDDRGSFSFGTNSFIREIDGDLWLTVNSYYDDVTKNWMRVDESKVSFALEMQGAGNIEFEVVQGFNVWKAQPAPNPIGSFGTVGGWEIAMLVTEQSNTVIGGMNFEIDGSGISPEFGRINQLEDGTYFSRNCYWDGARFVHDKVTQPAIALRINNRTGELDLLRAPKGSDKDIPYDGTTHNWPDVEWKEIIPIWHDKATEKRSAIRSTQSESQSFVAEEWGEVNFTNVEYDHLNEFDNISKFTAKSDGIYLISTSVSFLNMPADGRILLAVSVNGFEKSRIVDSHVKQTGSQFTLNGTTTLKLSEGDYMLIYGYSSQEVSTVAGDVLTHLEITKIA